MTVQLPKDVQSSIDAAVTRGHFSSADEMVAEIVREYFRCSEPPLTSQPSSATEVGKPIWEIFEEENRLIPAEIWDDLPIDLSAEHDHYIHGTPKRTDA